MAIKIRKQPVVIDESDDERAFDYKTGKLYPSVYTQEFWWVTKAEGVMDGVWCYARPVMIMGNWIAYCPASTFIDRIGPLPALGKWMKVRREKLQTMVKEIRK